MPKPNTADLEIVTGAPARFDEIVTRWQTERSDFAQSAAADLNAAALERRLEQFDADRRREVDKLATTVTRAHDRAATALDELIDPPPADSNEALLREMELQRAWTRAVRILDGSADTRLEGETIRLAEAAAADNDRATLRALRQELPGYYRARGSDSLVGSALATVNRAWVAAVEGSAEEALAERQALNIAWAEAEQWIDAARNGHRPLGLMDPGEYLAHRRARRPADGAIR